MAASSAGDLAGGIASQEEDEEEGEDEEEEAEEEEEKIRSAQVSYGEAKALLAGVLRREELETDAELRDAFDGHADYLHDESRNAAYRRAIDAAAKNSK